MNLQGAAIQVKIVYVIHVSMTILQNVHINFSEIPLDSRFWFSSF